MDPECTLESVEMVGGSRGDFWVVFEGWGCDACLARDVLISSSQQWSLSVLSSPEESLTKYKRWTWTKESLTLSSLSSCRCPCHPRIRMKERMRIEMRPSVLITPSLWARKNWTPTKTDLWESEHVHIYLVTQRERKRSLSQKVITFILT